MEILNNRAPLLLSQWKSYCPPEKIEAFISSFEKQVKFSGKRCLLALPLPILKEFAEKTSLPEIILGAKYMPNVAEKSYTAELAIPLLKKSQAKFVLVGNSESRHVMGESNDSINEKVKLLLEADIQPILCIGETLEEHNQSLTIDVLKKQIEGSLHSIEPTQLKKIIVLYEGPWVNRTSKHLSLADCQRIYNDCHQALEKALPESILHEMSIIYAVPEEIDDLAGILKLYHAAGYYSENVDRIFPMLDAISLHEPQLTSKPFKQKQVSEEQIVEGIVEGSQHFVPKTPSIEVQMDSNSDAVQNVIEEISPVLNAIEEISTVKITEVSKESTPIEEKKIGNKEEEESTPLEPSQTLEIIGNTPLSSSDESATKISALSSEEEIEVKPKRKRAPRTPKTEEPSEIAPPELKSEPTTNSTSEEKSDKLALPANEEEIILETFDESELPLLPPHEAPLNLPLIEEEAKPSEQHEIMQKIVALKEAEDELTDCYASLKEKVARMTFLRNEYPRVLEKVTLEMDKLNPEIKAHISQGDLDYFKQHPELFEVARPAFEHIQQLNEIIMGAAAIPREIDRLKPKAKKLREHLQKEWDQLSEHRLEVKKNHPDIQFPAQPKALQTPPPEIDLSLPTIAGPSPLTQKRIGVIQNDKKAYN